MLIDYVLVTMIAVLSFIYWRLSVKIDTHEMLIAALFKICYDLTEEEDDRDTD
jgi:hypothetical protein